jgi:hypothetical protein
MLQPRPTWRTSLEGVPRDERPGRLLFVSPLDPANPSALVWLQSMFRERLAALDAHTGATIGIFRLERDDERPSPTLRAACSRKRDYEAA